MTWTRIHTSTHQAIEFGGDRTPIAPFSFPVSGAVELLFEVASDSAQSNWFRAGWVNILHVDAGLPTFMALREWEILPLGESIIALPVGNLYQIRIAPVYYLNDLSLKVWQQ